MNFSKLPKEKRTQLIAVAVGTVVVLGALGFGLIRWQYGKLRQLADKSEVAQKELKRVQSAIQRADEIESEYKRKSQLLMTQEESMASGDAYSWVVNLLRRFKLPYKVEIPQVNQPTAPTDVNLLPSFPYKQVTLKVSGTGYYDDFGKFIADFENEFPHVRVANLSLEPAATGTSAGEKLQFTVDLIVLVKPNAP